MSKTRLSMVIIGLELLLLLMYPLPVQAQTVGGYVRVNSFERKVTPSSVYKGEKFQGLIKGDATLLKDLPLNTNVEVEYVVKAKLSTGQQEETVGQGTLKVGPLPSVKAGAAVNITESMDLIFPESAQPGQYTLVIEATSIKPFVIAMVADLIFPGLQSMSMQLGQVQYLGERPSGQVPNSKEKPPVGDIKLALYAPKEATATVNINTEVEVHVPEAEKVTVALYLQKGTEEKVPIKEISLAGDDRNTVSIPTPDYAGQISIVAEIKDYYVKGNRIVPTSPQVKSVDIALKRRPLQASGKVDDMGLIKQAFQIDSQDNKASVYLPVGTKAVTDDKKPVTELAVVGEVPPPAGEGYLVVGQAYKLMPEGAAFDHPVKVAIKYEKSMLPDNIEEDTLAISRFSEDTGWVKLPSNLDKEKQIVQADVEHFSLLAVLGEVAEGTRINYWLIGVLGVIVAVALFWGLWAIARR